MFLKNFFLKLAIFLFLRMRNERDYIISSQSLKIKRISTWGFPTSGGKAASIGMSRERGLTAKNVYKCCSMAGKQTTKSQINHPPTFHYAIFFQANSDCIVHHCLHPTRFILASSFNSSTFSTLQLNSTLLHHKRVH